ncbi:MULTISPECIES: flagellar motor protein MotA [unclassified Neorhizobium]|uniref:flagellar motor protein MotA n=1 Tax=unclassified Neorhizobium TaxID=2629175 RepID=UPI001FF109E3|nr:MULTISPECIES: flagellar motor protein MotA [unclassified Neorhizobium]MCJ9673880.1 flagellar motor protein MotA [Neorhizobium sp. SHOUNA12B]MCJ9746637.1 flagellar motor protein MotA [Neorhizobium sp. SHOUNA12A]
MANATVDDLDASETNRGGYAYKLSNPASFLWTMLIFLIIVGFVASILYRQAAHAFQTNPGLNGLILGVLLIGVILVFNQVIALMPEVRWFNSFRAAGSADKVGREPRLLAPMRTLIGSRRKMALSTNAFRSILDTIGTRLDESRDTSRYLIGLLVFLGLLGTFWGLIQTIGSISNVIGALDPSSGSSNDVLAAIKSGLAQPLAGMGTAFSSSLLGLSGSLILGFLDLQAGRAQNRFYTELENWLSSVTDLGSDMPPVVAETLASGSSEDLRALTEQLRALASAQTKGPVDAHQNERSLSAMANLAEGIQGLVKNMRNEQQMLRDWIEAQQEESKALRRTLDRLSDKIGGK